MSRIITEHVSQRDGEALLDSFTIALDPLELCSRLVTGARRTVLFAFQRGIRFNGVRPAVFTGQCEMSGTLCTLCTILYCTVYSVYC